MTRKNYYKYSLFAPLVMLTIVCPLYYFNALSGGATSIIEVIFGFVLYGGVPYVLLVSGFIMWMKNKEAEEIKKAYWRIPIYSIPFIIICAIGLSFVNKSHGPNVITSIFVGLGFVFIVIFYAHLVLVSIIEKVLVWKNIIEN